MQHHLVKRKQPRLREIEESAGVNRGYTTSTVILRIYIVEGVKFPKQIFSKNSLQPKYIKMQLFGNRKIPHCPQQITATFWRTLKHHFELYIFDKRMRMSSVHNEKYEIYAIRLLYSFSRKTYLGNRNEQREYITLSYLLCSKSRLQICQQSWCWVGTYCKYRV
jgi:hypothetical protein